MVSNIIVHLFSKCVHFYKYNAFTYVNEDEMTVYLFFYVLRRLSPEELRLKYIEYEENRTRLYKRIELQDFNTLKQLFDTSLTPFLKTTSFKKRRTEVKKKLNRLRSQP